MIPSLPSISHSPTILLYSYYMTHICSILRLKVVLPLHSAGCREYLIFIFSFCFELKLRNRCRDKAALVRLILRPVADAITITELMGPGTDVNSLPTLIWNQDSGIREFVIKQTLHYRNKAGGIKYSSEPF